MKAARTQLAMRLIEPELKAIQEKFKGKREEIARATMEAYRNAGVNPFSSIVLLFIQIPIVIALYFSVSRGGGVPLPGINEALLYHFVHVPDAASTMFLGFVDIVSRNLPLALLAGATQFIQTSIVMPKPKAREEGAAPDFKDDLARSMHLQMRYVMPVVIFFVAYTVNAAIALYFTVSNVIAIVQELIIRKRGLRNFDTTSGT
jgi:YidC/Oxa1 family membrane protein insertase